MCVFTAVFLLVLSLTNACVYINRFTRYAGEAFGTWALAVTFAPPHHRTTAPSHSPT